MDFNYLHHIQEQEEKADGKTSPEDITKAKDAVAAAQKSLQASA